MCARTGAPPTSRSRPKTSLRSTRRSRRPPARHRWRCCDRRKDRRRPRMINVVREGHGPPLLLVHGLGGSWRSWDPILPALADHREVVAVDLPGHGASPAEADSGTFAGLAASLERFILAGGMENVAAVGSSMGARLVLEMSRRGRVGAAVALDPGGFWRGWERSFFGAPIGASIKLVRAPAPVLPAISPIGSAECEAVGFESESGRWRIEELRRYTNLRCSRPRPFDRAGADRAGRTHLRPGDDRLGPAGSPLPAKSGEARHGRLSGRRDPLVRAQRPLPPVGPAG